MAKAGTNPVASVPGPGDLQTGAGRHGPKKVPAGMVRLKAVGRPKLQIYRPLGPLKPKVLPPNTGWTLTQRPRDIALTDWTGREPQRITFQILIDSQMKDIMAGRPGRPFEKRLSAEKDCRTLERMYGLVPNSPEPPKLIVDGGRGIPSDYVHAPHLKWVIETLDWEDDYDERNEKGQRTRAMATIVLMQWVKDERIPRLTAAHRRKKKGDKDGGGPIELGGNPIIRARKGDTLVKIATRVLGNARLWHKLAKLNKIRDGRKVLKEGQKIKVPKN